MSLLVSHSLVLIIVNYDSKVLTSQEIKKDVATSHQKFGKFFDILGIGTRNIVIKVDKDFEGF